MRITHFAALSACALVLVPVSRPWNAWAQAQQKEVSLVLANETVPLPTSADTVAELLGELQICLPSGVETDPPGDSALKDGMTVYLKGITVTRGTDERRVPAEVRFEEQLASGPQVSVVADPGRDGLVRTDYTIFYLNGKEIGRRERESVVQEMQPKCVVCFTDYVAGEVPSVDEILAERVEPGGHHEPPTAYKRVLTMESTAYEPGPTSCGKSANGRTACGLQAGYGVVAVDPRVIKLGTRLFIEGYGYAVAGDTGGAIKGNIVDVGFLTVDQCMQWGRRDVKVYILD